MNLHIAGYFLLDVYNTLPNSAHHYSNIS